MENPELPREEQLARIYELMYQLEVYDIEEWLGLAEWGVDKCHDCAKHRPRRLYGNVAVCESCGLMRIRVARQIAAERLAKDDISA